MLLYFLEFLVFAFLGWIIDSLYSSIEKKRLVISGYFRGIPLCPIYGFGGILLIHSFIYLADQPAHLVIIFTTLLIIALEYVGGLWAEHFLDERLWDYSKERFNLIYISAWHSFLWLVAVSVVYMLIGTRVSLYLEYLKQHLQLNDALETLLFFIVLTGVILLTSRQKKLRLAKIAKQQLERFESLDDFFDLEKWQKLAVDKQEKLLARWEELDLIKKLRNWRKEH